MKLAPSARVRSCLPLLALAVAACSGGGDDPVQVPTALNKVAGDIGGTVAQATAAAPTVSVTDASGRAVRGVVVNFAVTTGGGSVAATVDTTGGDGLATAGAWTLGTTAGMNTLVASSPTMPGVTAQFAATGAAGAPSRLAFVTTLPASLVASESFAGPTVEIRDAFGNRTNAASAVTISMRTVAGAPASLTGTTIVSAVDGRAEFGALTPNASGQMVLVASSGTLQAATSQPLSVIVSGSQVLQKVSGDLQVGAAGLPAFQMPVVRVATNTGAPVAAARVEFSVVSGSGSIQSTEVFTDAGGLATPGQWIYGTVGTNVVRATTPSASVDFTANVVAASPYHMELRFVNTPTPRQQQAFEAAWLRWRTIITGDVENASGSISNVCGLGIDFNGTVDDVIVYVKLAAIDGPGKTLGSAGPCATRTSGSRTPAIGVMTFDVADLADLEREGSLDQVIVHEMGHVLGIGTTWTSRGLLIGGGSDTSSFDGVSAKSGWQGLGGAAGSRVPVENCVGITVPCGPGTRDGHWRELTFRNELMTGYLNAGVLPISAMTLGSLQDIGYTVNMGAADPYTLPSSLMAGGVSGSVMADRPGRRIVEGPRTWMEWALDPKGGPAIPMEEWKRRQGL